MEGMTVKEVETGDRFMIASEPFLESEVRNQTKYIDRPHSLIEAQKTYSILLVSSARGIFRKVDLEVFMDEYVRN